MAEDFKILGEGEVITTALSSRGKFVLHLGAGVSQSARVPLAWDICEEIRQREERALEAERVPAERIKEILDERLMWDAPDQCYARCIREGLKSPAARIDFFRAILKDKTPGFSHNAVALLMDRGLVRRTCLTTNFDKLITSAFFSVGRSECQAIRTSDETGYWIQEDDKCYCLMLHGDYDTRSIRNIEEETGVIEEALRAPTRDLMKDSGLLVLGSAGHESSIGNLMDELSSDESLKRGVLSHGLFWGVYVGEEGDPVAAARERIAKGEVGNRIVGMMRRRLKQPMDFAFFPLRSSDTFFYKLISRSGDEDLIRISRTYLDHVDRVRNTLLEGGFGEDFVRSHVTNIALASERDQGKGEPRAVSTEVVRRDDSCDHTVVIAYGDITNEALALLPRLRGTKRAIVTSDDTYFTAGGGVALSILHKAGQRAILNELEKFSKPVGPAEVLVTSSGSFLTQYIFHTAIVGLDRSDGGKYVVNEEHISRATEGIVDHMKAMGVCTVYIPLLGSGVGDIKADRSLAQILAAIQGCKERAPAGAVFVVVVYSRNHLPPERARELCGQVLDRFAPGDEREWDFSGVGPAPA